MLAASGMEIEIGIVPPKAPPRNANSIPPVPKPRRVIAKIENEIVPTDTKTSENSNSQELGNHDSELQDDGTKTSLSDIGTPVALMQSESQVTSIVKDLDDDKSVSSGDTVDNSIDCKPPEIVGVLLKKSASKDSMHDKAQYDSHSPDTGVKNLNVNVDYVSDEYLGDVHDTKDKYASEYSSLDSSLTQTDKGDDDMPIDDLDIQMFSLSASKNSKHFRKPLKHLHSENDFDSATYNNDMPKNMSITSLKSVDSLPGFMDSTNMKKWANYQDLDEISNISDNLSHKNKWVVGDTTDTGMLFNFTNLCCSLLWFSFFMYLPIIMCVSM